MLSRGQATQGFLGEDVAAEGKGPVPRPRTDSNTCPLCLPLSNEHDPLSPLIPSAEFAFHRKLFRDLFLLEADWRGHGFGKCAWSSFKLDGLKYILAKGFSKAWLVT